MAKTNALCSLLILAVVSSALYAQKTILTQPGAFKSMQTIPHGVEIKAEHGYLQVICYSPSTIRVRMSKESFAPDFSYAVIEQPGSSFQKIIKNTDSIILETKALQVIVRKNPIRIAFRNKKGELLSEDYPEFGVTWLGDEVTSHRTLFPDETFIGLGEKTGPLNRRGCAYVNWNRDIPGYSDREDPLYQSIPFFIGIHDSLTYGIFLDNSYKTLFNFGASTDDQFSFFSAEGGELDYYFFGKNSVAGIIEDYTWLTGRMELPPYWSLGYQQCRWGYYPELEVTSLARKFRDKQIPCDVIYLDIDYMDAYKIFTWHPDRFPDPSGMIRKLNDWGFHIVVIVDPGIKIEPGYFAYDQGIGNDYFVKYPGGQFYTGSVWPGRCHFPDFTKEATRMWWGESFQSLVDAGVEGFWNDMNEPSAWGQSIPNIVEFDFDGHPTTMAEAHNIYGLEMSRATFEGTKKLINGKRPFILTRAGFSGIQRYSAVWTGDNSATDTDLLLGVRLVNSLGLSGVSFTGPDVGGFMKSPSKELFLRWLSVGIFTPFLRNHTIVNTKDQEPWSFGEDAERLSRALIDQRYRLLPYIYSMFYESSQTGLPVARSLAINYSYDPLVYDRVYQNQYLFGDAFLIAPVTSDQHYQKVYLPEGTWYRHSTDTPYSGRSEIIVEAPLNDLPVFVRGGSIIPLQSVIQYTDQKPDTTLEIHVYRGAHFNALIYYEDDGTTYNFENGLFYKRFIIFDPKNRKIIFTPTEGSFPSKFTTFKVIFHGFDQDISEKRVQNIAESFEIPF
ncbi:MAG: glycoside hydrolase family 31 protein [Bacteroidales bacterium]|nr:glycoside hydrolase family 31 protein [Bacteroidales bacterium]